MSQDNTVLDGSSYAGSPATVAYTDGKDVMKMCAMCGKEVAHKPVKVVGGLLDNQTLFRPWPHCNKCGHFRPPTEADDKFNRVHISCDCED